ncbi:MAG TPA: excinuclease ABC subunit UvrC [Candidatus Saccharimonadales bacterium]|nr:excinuclease ABC subunit UvrC [Candidatus Saccharimonadales bacterium]
MNKAIEAKLKDLPPRPGVYFHKDASGAIIYIGKAASLRNRVRQYFQQSRYRDPKTDILVNEIADIDWTEVETEADALFLEAELVRRYMPRFNILLRDDKSQLYVRIDIKSDYPTVTLVRRPLDDGAEYFGPFINSLAIKKALRYLRRAFPYATSRPVGAKRANLHYHLGLDPGLEEGRTSLEDYRANLRKLMLYLHGKRVALVRDIERDMKAAAKAQDFEKAAKLRNQLFSLQQLNRQILFGDRELQDAAKDEALSGLGLLLGLTAPPRRIEGFDISHMQGTDTVSSMVVFDSGVPNKTAYRKFKMRLAGNDDFAHMAETVARRLREDNRKKWGVADLMLIDGGKGQLSAALNARNMAGLTKIPMVGLAKREEEIIISREGSLPGIDITAVINCATKLGAYVSDSDNYLSILLPKDSPIVKLLQRIRDESHRFAVSYHTVLKRGRQTMSLLDEVPGVGPLTRKKLIKSFGSVRGVSTASQAEIAAVIGAKKAAILKQHLDDRDVKA